jgi:hypothetical protein
VFAPSAVVRKEEELGEGKRRSVEGEGAEEVDMGWGDVGCFVFKWRGSV